MKRFITQSISVVTLGLATAMTVGVIGLFAAEKTPPTQDKGVERTRQEIKMLDDLYKNAIVMINEHYVNSPSDLPAASAGSLRCRKAGGTRCGYWDLRT